jgi:hypothetical protein
MKTSFEKFMASSSVQEVELGAIKVELASLDQIKAAYIEGRKKLDKYNSDYNEGVRVLRGAFQLGNALSNDFDKVAKMYAELEKGIKDMGLDIRNYPDLQNAFLFFRQKTVVGQLQKDIEKLFK